MVPTLFGPFDCEAEIQQNKKLEYRFELILGKQMILVMVCKKQKEKEKHSRLTNPLEIYVKHISHY